MLELDANIYFNGPFRDGSVKGNHRLDMRVGIKPMDGLEISFVAQDMMNLKHLENENNSMQYATRQQQRWYARVTYIYK